MTLERRYFLTRVLKPRFLPILVLFFFLLQMLGRACKSRAELFEFSILPPSQVGYHAGKPIEIVVYCFNVLLTVCFFPNSPTRLSITLGFYHQKEGVENRRQWLWFWLYISKLKANRCKTKVSFDTYVMQHSNYLTLCMMRGRMTRPLSWGFIHMLIL